MTNVIPIIKATPKQVEHYVKADTDNGYYRVANELGEALCKVHLSDRESRLVHTVMLKTFGWNKSLDWICNDQFSELTGIKPTHISEVKKSLLSRKILVVEGKKIGLNKVVSEWEMVKKTTPKQGKTTPKQGCRTPKQGKNIPQIGNHKRQDTITKDRSSLSQKKFCDDDLIAAEYIFKKIIAIQPNAKKPNLDSWADQIRLIRERDKKTHREICELFKWANADSFWQSNILSPSKLRKNWDALEIKSKPSTPKPNENIDAQLEDTSWADNLDDIL